MTQIQAHGQIRDGRVRVELDLGFGTLTLDIAKDALGDEDNLDLMVEVLENSGDPITQVLEALVAKGQEQEQQ